MPTRALSTRCSRAWCTSRTPRSLAPCTRAASWKRSTPCAKRAISRSLSTARVSAPRSTARCATIRSRTWRICAKCSRSAARKWAFSSARRQCSPRRSWLRISVTSSSRTAACWPRAVFSACSSTQPSRTGSMTASARRRYVLRFVCVTASAPAAGPSWWSLPPTSSSPFCRTRSLSGSSRSFRAAIRSLSPTA